MPQMIRMKRLLIAALCASAFAAGAQRAVAAAADPTRLLSEAEQTVEMLANAPQGDGMADAIRAGHGVLIVPKLLRAGVVVGGNGGNGVLLARNPETGHFGNPIFVELKGASIGLQIGAETMQAVFVLKTEAAVEALLSREVKLNADVSVVVGDDDKYRADRSSTIGAEQDQADIVAFADGEGLYAGTSVSGTLVDLKKDWNGGVYGNDKSMAEIARIERPLTVAASRLMVKLATL